MEFHLIPHSLPGFADTQTIRIVYDIPTGIQVSPQALNSAAVLHCRLWFKPPAAPPHRALSTPTQARSSLQEASHATAICPTTRRAGRWVPRAQGGVGAGRGPSTEHSHLVCVCPALPVASKPHFIYQPAEVKVLTPF